LFLLLFNSSQFATDWLFFLNMQERLQALEVREQLAAEITAQEAQTSIQLKENLRAHEKQLAAIMDAAAHRVPIREIPGYHGTLASHISSFRNGV
jgi:hypothetical protein